MPFPAPLPLLPRPGQLVSWRNIRHAHALGWVDAYGPGPFVVVGIVDKSHQDIPDAVILQTSLGEKESPDQGNLLPMRLPLPEMEKEAIMNTPPRLIAVDRRGDTLMLTPGRDLGELDSCGIEAEKEALLRLTDEPSFRNVVVDLCRTDYLGSTALELFLQIWQRVRGRGGRMALCNVSALEKDILTVTRLAGLWPSYPSRAEAITAVMAGNGIPEK